MRKCWVVFFIFWPILAIVVSAISPAMHWWFPGATGEPETGLAQTPIGRQIDDLFYLILVIVTMVFILTQIVMGYVLWRGASGWDEKPLFTHGSHNLEVIWTIVPSGILLFVALYQMEVWAQFRIQSNFPPEAVKAPIAEVTARQFEWRIRYPGFDEDGNRLTLQATPQATDLYTVNDLHVPTGRPVMIQLRSGDVQHSFFVPELRVKQDAVPNLVIPIWFEVLQGKKYDLVCAELCGWGHYKMRAQLWAQSKEDFHAYLQELKREQNYDGVE